MDKLDKPDELKRILIAALGLKQTERFSGSSTIMKEIGG